MSDVAGSFQMRPFQGYLRADGRVGVRNHMLILGINGLALRSSERIARNLPGSLLVATSAGRGQVEPDLGLHLDQLVGLGRNPNVGAVLVVGVDQATSDDVAARIALSGKPVASVSFAECGEDALAISDLGLRRATELSRAASRARRTRVEPTALVVAVECGHSDATSGLASNPIVGAAVDRLVAAGACVIVGETVEWLGAEHLRHSRPRGVQPRPGASSTLMHAGGVARHGDALVEHAREVLGDRGVDRRGGVPVEIDHGLVAFVFEQRNGSLPLDAETIEEVLHHLALEGGPIFWVATHRVHHQHSDHDGDPHTPHDGTWWAVFLATRHASYDQFSTIGRETFLAPVEWHDGWPVVLTQATRELQVRHPTLPPPAPGCPTFTCALRPSPGRLVPIPPLPPAPAPVFGRPPFAGVVSDI